VGKKKILEGLKMDDNTLFNVEDGKMFLTWKAVDFGLQKIVHEAKLFKRVVGIERGGLILALMLSEVLDIPWGTYNPKMRSASLKSRPDGSLDDVLLIDDIQDSGKTLKMFREDCPGIKNIAVLVQRETCKDDSVVVGLKANHDRWIVFPWEVGLGRVKGEGKDYEKRL